jgi:hypothetical protein
MQRQAAQTITPPARHPGRGRLGTSVWTVGMALSVVVALGLGRRCRWPPRIPARACGAPVTANVRRPCRRAVLRITTRANAASAKSSGVITTPCLRC